MPSLRRPRRYGRERLEIKPTPVNIKYAERLRLEILGKIELGTFALADYFPDSPRVKKDAPSLTWAEVAAEWKKVKRGEIAHSYAQTLSSKHFADWQELRMNALDYRALMAKLAQLPQHPKTWNNIASVLRMVLEYAAKAKLLRDPLHEHIEMRRPKKPQPDPFTQEEVELMQAKMRNERSRLFYEFAFFSGLRPSKQIALRWPKVDFRRDTVTIDTAFTRSAEKGTKTGIAREVELTGRALACLSDSAPSASWSASMCSSTWTT